ncbi:MAG: hypothetical protein AMXMBFR53_42060 [Gemmatimonadota bacterium]
MSRPGATVLGAALILSGCVYYNALYNAERLFDQGDRERREGRDSVARVLYQDVVRKAAEGYRREPEGEWADEALLLMGRAYLRLGELREARSALEEAALRAGTPEVRFAAELSLGVARVQAGDVDGGTPMLSRAIDGLSSSRLRAEGHLWRGQALLAAGQPDGGWWDLDQAAAEPAVRVDAALTRVLWGIRTGNRTRVVEGMNRLLRFREGGERVDSVAALARAAADRWGEGTGVQLLAGVDSARWDRTPRGMIRLTRAAFLRQTGDTAAAAREVRRVADGIGPAATEARLRLAAWQLSQARDLLDARAALPLLLPAVADPRVARLVEDLQGAIALAERGFDEPLAWFAAAEIARDGLGAPDLALGLFLAYADAATPDPWVPKALLAALSVARAEGDQAWLRGRLEPRADSPYVLAARGEPALGLEALEEELARRLEEMRSR